MNTISSYFTKVKSKDLKPIGLLYYPLAIHPSVYNDVLQWWQTEEVQNILKPINYNGHVSKNARQVIQFGSLYLYDKKQATSQGSALPIPSILIRLRHLIPALCSEIPNDYLFDQVIINRYLPGQGIRPHSDLNVFGEYIVSFTFQGGREMEFTQDKQDPFKIYVEPQSMYVMTGESRYLWKHQMRPRRTDGKLKRIECFSITFRKSPKQE